jgi:hypothetical protein
VEVKHEVTKNTKKTSDFEFPSYLRAFVFSKKSPHAPLLELVLKARCRCHFRGSTTAGVPRSLALKRTTMSWLNSASLLVGAWTTVTYTTLLPYARMAV